MKFRIVNIKTVTSEKLYDRDGRVIDETVQKFTHLFKDAKRNVEHPIDPRLLKLLFKIAYHFDADVVEIISGYRKTPKWSESYHGKGKAVDFRIPGVLCGKVASYARTLGKVGVGWYPVVDFVHLDVRDQSYFWMNRSGRGKHGWHRPLARKGGLILDGHWTQAWDAPGFVPPYPEAVERAANAKDDVSLRRIQKKRAQDRRRRRVKNRAASTQTVQKNKEEKKEEKKEEEKKPEVAGKNDAESAQHGKKGS